MQTTVKLRLIKLISKISDKDPFVPCQQINSEDFQDGLYLCIYDIYYTYIVFYFGNFVCVHTHLFQLLKYTWLIGNLPRQKR